MRNQRRHIVVADSVNYLEVVSNSTLLRLIVVVDDDEFEYSHDVDYSPK